MTHGEGTPTQLMWPCIGGKNSINFTLISDAVVKQINLSKCVNIFHPPQLHVTNFMWTHSRLPTCDADVAAP